MTREEVITILKDISWQMGSVKRWENIEAIDMAIEALQSTMSQERVNHESTNDLISRADAIEAVRKELVCDGRHDIHDKVCRFIADVLLPALPSAKGGDAEMNEAKSPYMQQSPNNGADLSAEAVQGFRGGKIPPKEMLDGTVLIPKHQWIKMERELANLKQEFESADAEWIPCSERLPEDSGDYLVCPSDGVIEDYSDCSDVMIMPYDADCEAFGWWTERYDPISLGFVDSDFNEFEVVAWMPLPMPYREDGEV